MLAVLICSVSILAPVPKPPSETTAKLEVEATKLKVGDPLIVLATLQIGANKAVTLKDIFSLKRYAVYLEVCNPNGVEYQRVNAYGQGSDGRPLQPTKLSDGFTVRSFGQLSAGEKASPFQQSGDWKLRIRVLCENEDVISEPVIIRVSERTKAGTVAVRTYVEIIDKLKIPRDLSTPNDFDKLAALVPDLETSNLQFHIERSTRLVAVQLATDAMQLEHTMNAVHEYRKSLNAVQQEYLDIGLAGVLLIRKPIEYAKASDVLKRIGQTSYEKQRYDAIIESHRIEEEQRSKDKMKK